MSEPQAPTQGSRSGSPSSSEELARQIIAFASEKKASEIVELDLRGVVGYTDRFIVCSGNTERQTKAIHNAIVEGVKHEHGLFARRVEGLPQAQWILIDYLDVVVHIFTPQTREFYRLERLWGEAPMRTIEDTEPAAVSELMFSLR